jgi:hypothetical protein
VLQLSQLLRLQTFRENGIMAKKPEKKPENSPKKITLAGRVDPKLKATVEKLADNERRKTSQMMEILIEEALQARKLWS